MADDLNGNEWSSEGDELSRHLGLALLPYQVIEGLLKLYITDTHSLIALMLGGQIPFRFTRKEYENAPMERLITMFARHCDNDDLIKRLRSALTSRNYVAHEALRYYVEHDDAAESALETLKGIQKEGLALMEELYKECRKLEATFDSLQQASTE